MGPFVWFSCLLPESWSLNWSMVSVLQIFPDVSKKSKAVTAIYAYAYASERFRFALLQNGTGYYVMN